MLPNRTSLRLESRGRPQNLQPDADGAITTWTSLKRDLGRVANDVLRSHNPDAMREAFVNIHYLLSELRTCTL